MRWTSCLPLMGALAGSGACGMRMPAHVSEETICENETCSGGEEAALMTMKYERLSDAQPGYQWNDAGGYCGSWSIQRASMTRGAYISQQQVRSHTSAGGGHDNEILSTNIVEAFDNLKLEAEGFDFENTPMPQMPAYFKWLKAQLVQGFPVAWMILWNGMDFPIYDLTPPAGMYGHVEPVIGIQSNHPLDDPNVYDDDVVLHFTDGGLKTIHRKLTSMQAGKWEKAGDPAQCGVHQYCMGPWGFGWAIKGFQGDTEAYVPAALHVNPWHSEPDTRNGATAIPLQGSLRVSDLVPGAEYQIYRWDSVPDALTYTAAFQKSTFTPNATAFVYDDPMPFMSNSTTYYRVVKQ